MDEIKELIRAYNESGEDHNRIFATVMIGDKDKPFHNECIIVERGNPGQIIEKYDLIKVEIKEFYNQDVGLATDAFFVLCDDCQTHANPLIKSFFDIYDEWNVFFNAHHDVNKEYLKIWQLRKLTYQQLYDKIKNMIVQPKNPNQKYDWTDRVD